MKSLVESMKDAYKGSFKGSALYLVLALACLVVLISAQGGFVSKVNTVAGELSDKLDTMSIASGGSSQM